MSRTLFAAALGACLVSAAHAQASYYTLFRTNGYEQTSATTVSFGGAYLASSILSTDPGNYGDATLTDPSSTVFNYSQSGASYNYGTFLYTGATADADLLSDHPHGTYTYDLTAGNESADTATLEDAIDRWSPDVAMVQEYDALQHATAGQAFTLHYSGFTAGAGTNDDLAFYDLYDITANHYDIINNTADDSAFAIDIAPGDLQAGHQYAVHVYYSSRLRVLNAGFFDPNNPGNGATSYDGYDNLTTTLFTVSSVPEPASFAALGLGALALARRRRR